MGIDFICSAMLGIVHLFIRVRRPVYVEVSVILSNRIACREDR